MASPHTASWVTELPEPTLVLTAEQITSFREHGFLAVPAITTPEEVARLRDEYDRIFAEGAGREVGRIFDLSGTDDPGEEAALPQLLDPQVYAPVLRNTLYEANALACARQLIGDTAEHMYSHAIRKPERMGAATPWHQDEAYAPPELDYGRGGGFNVVNSWMPLQPCDADSGCMQFIPGSHLDPVLPHHHKDHNPRIHALELDDGAADLSTAVACPLPAGGATFHLMRTLHYTAPNTTPAPRRAFIHKFGLPEAAVPVDDPPERPWQTVTETTAGNLRKAAQDAGILVGRVTGKASL